MKRKVKCLESGAEGMSAHNAVCLERVSEGCVGRTLHEHSPVCQGRAIEAEGITGEARR